VPYKIELKYIYGWDDAEWTGENNDGVAPTPMRFRTIEAAQTAINEFFAVVSAAVTEGSMGIEEDKNDYRIVEIAD
jgi:hypothetical protein